MPGLHHRCVCEEATGTLPLLFPLDPPPPLFRGTPAYVRLYIAFKKTKARRHRRLNGRRWSSLPYPTTTVRYKSHEPTASAHVREARGWRRGLLAAETGLG